MSFRVRRIREFLARALRPTRKKVVIAVLAVVVLGALIFWSVRMRGSVQPGGSVANVTTQLTYPVAEIRVQVGDEVSKGDVICVLDTTDLEKELAQKQESLSDTIATSQKNYDTALENYDSATDKLNSATSEYQSTGQALESARNAFQNVNSSVTSYQTAYDTALEAQQKAGAALNSDSGAGGRAG